MTLPGGEPLAQPDFALALLAVRRRAGFHTAIGTSLFAPARIVDEAAALPDTIIAGRKIFDDERHRAAATGQDNALNLGRLQTPSSRRFIAARKSWFLRCKMAQKPASATSGRCCPATILHLSAYYCRKAPAQGIGGARSGPRSPAVA
ncbi:MAG: hypothetical protein LBF63_10790, partial [Treponema sp.]|nr:hypothetical protein [Treponema sp.]